MYFLNKFSKISLALAIILNGSIPLYATQDNVYDSQIKTRENLKDTTIVIEKVALPSKFSIAKKVFSGVFLGYMYGMTGAMAGMFLSIIESFGDVPPYVINGLVISPKEVVKGTIAGVCLLLFVSSIREFSKAIEAIQNRNKAKIFAKIQNVSKNTAKNKGIVRFSKEVIMGTTASACRLLWAPISKAIEAIKNRNKVKISAKTQNVSKSTTKNKGIVRFSKEVIMGTTAAVCLLLLVSSIKEFSKSVGPINNKNKVNTLLLIQN